jgi:hypothetical protein
MTPLEVRARQWCAAASIGTQVAATFAGMLPWWGLPLTVPLTVVLARPPRSVELTNSRVARGLAVAAVAAFAILIAIKTVAAGSTGADPVATLRSLTEALVVLSLVIAPSARTPREHRVWLTVTTGVLVAAAAGGHSRFSATLTVVSWVILLIAMARVQQSTAYSNGALGALETAPATTRSRATFSSWWTEGAVIPVAAALVAGGLVFLSLPSGLGGGDIARRIAHGANGGDQGPPASRSQLGVDTQGFGDLSLLVRGALPNTPVLRVPLHSPVLWRGTSYSNYTGSGWNDGANAPLGFLRGTGGSIPSSSADPLPTGPVRTDLATLATPAQESLIWAPGVPVHLSVRGSGVEGISRGSFHLRAFGRVGGISSYVVRSVVASTSPKVLRSAAGPDPSDPEWTALPAELPSDVGALAHQITADTTTRYDAVRAIEDYLRKYETYSLDSPVPGKGQDAVADFLFRDHTGFCEQFASAEAVLLRTLGIPARVVTGLAYGTRSGTTRLYTAANAHAWDEVYYPGVGWSSSDPTAGSVLAPVTVGHHSAVDRALRGAIDHLPGGRPVLLGLATTALVGLGVVIAGMFRRRGRWTLRRGRRSPTGPVLTAFLRLTGSANAPAPRAAHETAREYLARTVEPGSLDDALETLEQECYGQNPPDSVTTTEAVQAFATIGGHRRR